jgi:nucleoside-diphosphate-sugar epimerase
MRREEFQWRYDPRSNLRWFTMQFPQRVLQVLERNCMRPLAVVLDSLPSSLYGATTQFAIDSLLSGIALYSAFHIRFDNGIPPGARPVMWAWIMLLGVIRPVLMWKLGAYNVRWRFFSLRDALVLGFSSLPASLAMLGVRLGFPNKVWLTAIPLGVIAIDSGLFLGLIGGVRILRRLAAEAALSSSEEIAQALMIGDEQTIAAGIRQCGLWPELKITGLVIPNARKNGLEGASLSGIGVLGEPSDLAQILTTARPDLILISNVSLGCTAMCVAISREYGIKVRLLPSAANVMRGDVRISTSDNPRADRVERVLVVGGAGYLGSALVPQLLERGYNVRVLDSLLFGDQSLRGVARHPQFELLVGDVRDIQALVHAVRDCDAVVHLAAIVGDPACEIDKDLSVEVNRAATRMLIDICRGYGVQRFLFASTCSVYGSSDSIVTEFSELAPLSLYAQTKLDSENLLLEAVAATPNFHPTILRLGTLFGLSARPRFDLVVNLLTARAASTGRITIYNGEQWRPFLHVRDAAKAFRMLLEAETEAISGQIFNVGDNRLNLRLADVSEKIASMIPATEVQHVDNGDRRNYRACFDRIRTNIGFECDISVEQGISEMYHAIRLSQIEDFTDARFNNHVTTKAFAASPLAAKSSLRVLNSLAQAQRAS